MESFATAPLCGSASAGVARGSVNFPMIEIRPGHGGCLRSGDHDFHRGGSIGVVGMGITSSRKVEKKGAVFVRAKSATGSGGGGGGGWVAKYKGTQKREKQLTEMIEKKVKEAKEVCDGDERSDGCKVAWDEVEEVSQAKADLRLKLLQKQDPLESFCHDNPETDECRIYDD